MKNHVDVILTDEQCDGIVDHLKTTHDREPFLDHSLSSVIEYHFTEKIHRENKKIVERLRTLHYVVRTWTITDDLDLSFVDQSHTLVMTVYPDHFYRATLDEKPITLTSAFLNTLFGLAFYRETTDEKISFNELVMRKFIPVRTNPDILPWFHAWRVHNDVSNSPLWESLDLRIIHAFREGITFGDCVEKIFGVHRKDLIKTVNNAHPDHLHLAVKLYDPSMPIDVVIRFLQEMKNATSTLPLSEYAALSTFSLESRRKMLNNFRWERDGIPLIDLCYLMKQEGDHLPEPHQEVKHLKEAEAHLVSLNNTRHRLLAKEAMLDQARREKKHAAWLTSPAGLAWQERQDELEHRRLAELEEDVRHAQEQARRDQAVRADAHDALRHTLDGFSWLTPGGKKYIIRVARHTAMLEEWGNHLGTNCIGNGGYHDYINDFGSCLFGVYTGSIIPKNIVYVGDIPIDEKGNYKLRQFLGHNNRRPNEDDIAPLIDLLTTHGVKNTSTR